MANPKKLNVYRQSDFEQESDSEQEQVSEQRLDSNPGTSLNYFRNFGQPAKETTPPSNKWTRFGKVKRLIIYPVDHGTGLTEKTVVCTDTGPEFYTNNSKIRSVKDRALVIYKTGHGHVHLEAKDAMINLSNKMDFYYGDVEIDPNRTIRVTQKRYETMVVPIYVRKDDIYCQRLKMQYQMKDQKFQVAYLKPEIRSQLNAEVRYTHENWRTHGLLANFSHYTIVNTRSVNHFKSEFDQEMRNQRHKVRSDPLSYLNFFPHIVIEGDPGTEYQEDSVIAMKIGNVEFNQILPCIHYEHDLKLNHTNKDKHFELIYEYLLAQRPISECFSEYHHDDAVIPVFGLNMEKVKVERTDDEFNKISEKDIVYVKFRDSSNPLASNPP